MPTSIDLEVIMAFFSTCAIRRAVKTLGLLRVQLWLTLNGERSRNDLLTLTLLSRYQLWVKDI